MKKYTVILIYPDTVAEQYGEEFYIARVTTKTEKLALKRARRLALATLVDDGYDALDLPCEADDFSCVAMFEGHHDNVNPEG